MEFGKQQKRVVYCFLQCHAAFFCRAIETIADMFDPDAKRPFTLSTKWKIFLPYFATPKSPYSSATSTSGSFPISLATTGVNSTVGGNRMGLAALCAA